MMIFPDIYLLSGPAYGIHQNVYGIDFPAEKRLVLIDCGLDQKDLSVISSTMARFSLADRKITDVFITHSHFDHSGNAAALAEEGAAIRIGEADAESIRTGDAHTLNFAYGMAFPTVSEVLPVQDGEHFMLPDAEIIAHHTPGHSRGSICYELRRDGRALLFTGDFLQVDQQGNVIPGIKVDPDYCYTDYLNSAERLKDLTVDAVLCGHYQPVIRAGANHLGQLYRELLVERNKYM